MNTRVGRAVAAMAGLLMLSGCLPGIGIRAGERPAGPDEMVQDPVTERWFIPSEVTEDPSVIKAKFPQLEDASGLSVDGQYSDPHERAPIPAPDDYWWQAVIVADPAYVAELAEEAARATASDGGGDQVLTGEGTSVMNEPAGTRADDDVIHGQLMEPLEDEAGTCPQGWILLGMTLTADLTDTIRPVTADGLVISMAAVCEGGDRIVVDSTQF